ncbi:MAG: class A beta-lactamase [Terriglobia bacterium]
MEASRVYFRIFAAAVVSLTLSSLSPLIGATERSTATIAQDELQHSLNNLAQEARPGLLGVDVLDLQSGIEVQVNANHAYPMMSVFKAPVAAVVLSRIDKGQLSLEQKVTINRVDVEAGSAVPSIGANFHGEQMTFTVNQLLSAAVSDSDNTAADALVKLVGGPRVVTAFLRAHGIEGMRVDLDEAGVGRIFEDFKPGEKLPPNESPQEAHRRNQRGYKAYLSDPRNRSTPIAAVLFLRELWSDELLSRQSTDHLLSLLYDQTVPNRLRAGLPNGIRLADKCGTSYSLDGETAAYNDIGILTGPNGHTVIVAAFLTASRASKAERDALFADLARNIITTFHL